MFYNEAAKTVTGKNKRSVFLRTVSLRVHIIYRLDPANLRLSHSCLS